MKYDMVIIGGGVSGLSLAHYLAKSEKKILVLEACQKHGGCINTHHSSKDDFWLEMGAHTVYNSYSKLINIALDNNLKDKIIVREKRSLKLFNGKLQGIFSKINKLEMFRSLPRVFFLKKEGESVQSFYSKILGKKNYKKIFSRMFSAVIVQDADEYAADLFLKRRKTRCKDFPKSFTFTKGVQELLDNIINKENITLKTNSKVVKLLQNGKTYTIKTAAGDNVQTKKLALAVSPKTAAALLNEIHFKLSDLLSDIPVQKIHTRAVKLSKKDIDIEPLSFIIPLEGACYSVVTRDVVEHPDLRGFAFHFKDGELNDNEQLQIMSKVLGVEPAKLENTTEYKHSLPLLKVGHPEKVKQIDKILKNSEILLTGNYFDGLSLEDCVARSWREFNRCQ